MSCPQPSVLTEQVAEAATGMLDNVCGARGWPVICQELQPDGIHFLSIPPSTAVDEVFTMVKDMAAHQLWARFPVLRKLCHYAGAADNARTDTIPYYIERAKHSKGRE